MRFTNVSVEHVPSRDSWMLSNCSETNEILNDQVLQVAFIAGAALAVTAVVTNVLLLTTLFRPLPLHKNLRLLLGNMSVSAIAFCVSYFGRAVHTWASRFSPCKLTTTHQRCIAVELPWFVTIVALVDSIVGICVERFIATQAHATYYKASRFLGAVLMTACWIHGPVVGLMLYFLASDSSTISFCSIVFVANEAVIGFTLLSCFLLNVALVGAYLVLIGINRQKLVDFCANQAFLSLNSRLQLRHNIGVAEMLLPSVVLLCLAGGGTNIVSAYLRFSELPLRTKIVSFYAASLGLVLFALLHPVICLSRMRNRRQLVAMQEPKLVQSQNRRRSTGKCAATAEYVSSEQDKQDAHFLLLENMWSKKSKGRNGSRFKSKQQASNSTRRQSREQKEQPNEFSFPATTS